MTMIQKSLSWSGDGLLGMIGKGLGWLRKGVPDITRLLCILDRTLLSSRQIDCKIVE